MRLTISIGLLLALLRQRLDSRPNVGKAGPGRRHGGVSGSGTWRRCLFGNGRRPRVREQRRRAELGAARPGRTPAGRRSNAHRWPILGKCIGYSRPFGIRSRERVGACSKARIADKVGNCWGWRTRLSALWKSRRQIRTSSWREHETGCFVLLTGGKSWAQISPEGDAGN